MDLLLESRCIDLARELTDAYSHSTPPFSFDSLTEHFGVAGIRERPLDRDACLRAESGRIFIDVNSMYPLTRRRLSIAHEFGHLIVRECSAEKAWGDADPAIESLCNRLAGYLLAPEPTVKRYFESKGRLGDWQDSIRCSTVVAAAAEFGLSVDATAARVFREIDLAPGRVALIWRVMAHATRNNSGKALRIASVWHGRFHRAYIPRNKTVHQGSLISRAYDSNYALSGIENLSLGTLRGTFNVEALSFGRLFRGSGTGHRSVLSLLSSADYRDQTLQAETPRITHQLQTTLNLA